MSTGVRLETTSITLPDGLDSAGAKLVYLYIDCVGGATVEDIADGVDMKRIALFSVLDTLTDRGLVEHDGDQYVPA